MGCDIHLFVEVRKKGKWVLAPGQVGKCRWCKGTKKIRNLVKVEAKKGETDPAGQPLSDGWEESGKPRPCYCTDKEEGGGPGPGKSWESYYHERNYDLFAILAGVRNGVAFAGSPTSPYPEGEKFKPIDEPRGLPPEVSEVVAKQSARWGEDGHSHSFVKKTIPKLKKLGKPENVRIAFWFDN